MFLVCLQFSSNYRDSSTALEDTHPGNMVAAMEVPPEHNPITKWMDIDGSVFLIYPSFTTNDVPNHPIGRWDVHSVKLSNLGGLGDNVKVRVWLLPFLFSYYKN